MMTPIGYFTARPSTRCYISRHLQGSGGLDAETFCGAQLAGELFLLTSLFIEPKGERIPKSELFASANMRKFERTLLRGDPADGPRWHRK
jgi:hypothetical protein